MAKIICVGQIGFLIRYHSGNRGLQKKAASQSCDQRREAERWYKRPSPAKTLTVNTDLSGPLRRMPESYNWGSFQKVRPGPLLGVSRGPLF